MKRLAVVFSIQEKTINQKRTKILVRGMGNIQKFNKILKDYIKFAQDLNDVPKI